jgi:hypothetical protein
MAQDKNGLTLATGDKVLVECTVTYAGPRPIAELIVQPPDSPFNQQNVSVALASNEVVKGTLP